MACNSSCENPFPEGGCAGSKSVKSGNAMVFEVVDFSAVRLGFGRCPSGSSRSSSNAAASFKGSIRTERSGAATTVSATDSSNRGSVLPLSTRSSVSSAMGGSARSLCERSTAGDITSSVTPVFLRRALGESATNPSNSASICATSASGGFGATRETIFCKRPGISRCCNGDNTARNHELRLSMFNCAGWLFAPLNDSTTRPMSDIKAPRPSSTSGQCNRNASVKPSTVNNSPVKAAPVGPKSAISPSARTLPNIPPPVIPIGNQPGCGPM